MKQTTRRWIAILLTLVLLLGVAACGKTNTKTASRSEVVTAPNDPTVDQSTQTPSTPNSPSSPNDPGIGWSPEDDGYTDDDDDSGYTGLVDPDDWWEDDTPVQDPPNNDGAATVWLSTYDKNAKTHPISSVKWWYNSDDGTYYLFLPAAFAKSELQIWMQGDSVCTIDEVAFENGARIKSLSTGDHTLILGGTTYPLTVMRSANIGAMYITTKSGSMNFIHANKENRESGRMMMVDANGKTVYNDALSEIKGRGNATWKREKKPYQIKLEKKADLIGNAGKAKTWILLANYLERTMFRNAFAYDLAYQAGLTETSLSTYVDLYCNGEYRGTYQVAEKVQISEDRIAIQNLEKATQAVNGQELDTYPTFGPREGKTAGNRKGYEIPNNPKDITGGYLLELDKPERYEEDPSGFVTNRGQAVIIKEPKCASREQVNYIANYFQEFEDAVFSDDGRCPTTGKYYYEYFDLTSLARKYIIEELTKNIDIDETSQYYYKPSDSESKVGFCGPVWDFDNSMANHGNPNALKPDGLYAATRKKYITYQLYQNEAFLKTVKKEWNATFKPLVTNCVTKKTSAPSSTLKTIDEYSKMLTPSAAMNFTRWDNIDKVDTSAYNDTGSTYPEHVSFLKDFLRERLAFLNQKWK